MPANRTNVIPKSQLRGVSELVPYSDNDNSQQSVHAARQTWGYTVGIHSGRLASMALIEGTAGNDTLVGTEFKDTIQPYLGVNHVNAGNGNDVIVSVGGTDSINGGAGYDTWLVRLQAASAGYSLSFNGLNGYASLSGVAKASAIERLEADLGSGEDVVRLNDVSDASVNSGQGADQFLIARGSRIAIDGGVGADSATIYFANTFRFSESVISSNGNGGFDGVISRYDGVSFTNIEKLTATLSDASDLVRVDLASLAAGASLKMNGGKGSDHLTLDFASFASAIAAVRTDGSLSFGNGQFSGFEYFRLEGSPGPDRFTGGASGIYIDGREGNDIIRGGAGNDILIGGSGDDKLYGLAGFNELYGGLGNDTYYISTDTEFSFIIEYFNEGTDTVYASVSTVLTENVERLVLTGIADIAGSGGSMPDTLIGNAGANLLQGDAGKDYISGGAGRDTLYGGSGADTLSGGDGSDSFVFDTLETSRERDVIKDFSTGVDTIQLYRNVFPAFSALPFASTMPNENFTYGKGATNSNHHVIYDVSTGSLYYDPDGSGGENQVMIAILTGNPAITSGDILLL